jgi:hypothetical protein
MRMNLLNRLAVVTAAGAAAGCVAGGGAPPPLPALSADQDAPVLALFAHVLADYFAGAGANAPTTCATLRPGPLTAEQEEALIIRFVRLAPVERCKAEGSERVDAITGSPAALVEVYDFACANETLCGGWAAVPGRPATRYVLQFENDAWRVTGDTRIGAE